MADRLDIVIFGATGFTGLRTIPQLYKLTKTDGRALTWGIAGRSKQKLKEALIEAAKLIGVTDLNSIPIIIADVNDEESIKQMTTQAKIIINCCGPYHLYGEVVIKSCIESGTHYVDVTAETQFIEGMLLKYRKAAEEKGVYIISACGFDCIPADLGVVFLGNNFQGTLNSVEVYMDFYEEGGFTASAKGNYGTWQSAVYMMNNISKIVGLRKKLKLNQSAKLDPKLSLRFPLHKGNMIKKWSTPFPGADRDVIMLSQRYLYEHDRKRPIQVYCYTVIESLILVLLLGIVVFVAFVLAQFQFGLNLLLKYPRVFSFGVFSLEGPSEEVMAKCHAAFTFYGEGWSEKLAEGEDHYKTPPNKAIVGRVSAVNPGYRFTCYAVTLCAIMILTERKKMPIRGGVYTTAVAFSKTSLIKQLQKNGAVFEILSVKDL